MGTLLKSSPKPKHVQNWQRTYLYGDNITMKSRICFLKFRLSFLLYGLFLWHSISWQFSVCIPKTFIFIIWKFQNPIRLPKKGHESPHANQRRQEKVSQTPKAIVGLHDARITNIGWLGFACIPPTLLHYYTWTGWVSALMFIQYVSKILNYL